MKTHTSQFKNEVKKFGRQIDSKITYEIDDTMIELGKEDLNSITPSFQGSILKSTMKELVIDSNVDIPLETIIKYKFGVLINGSYEYLDFGSYIVYSSEKQEDTKSYKITCYDLMLRSMTEYNELQTGQFPMSVREYITKLCNDISLDFANENQSFANFDKVIPNDLYANLGYTYRDIFDELSQVTASSICINKNDKLEIRYINDTNDTIDEEYLKDINVNFGEKYGPINSIVLSRSGESDNVYLQDEDSVEENGLCELKIIDNQIMNDNNRSDYLEDILDTLDGLEYYINDFSSTGICYYDLCDKYNVKIGDNTYSCIMFNDEINITQGLEENIFSELLEESQTDYTKADKTDRKINQAYIIVDKQNQQINSVVTQMTDLGQLVDSQGKEITSLGTQLTQTRDNIVASVTSIQEELENGVSKVKNTLVTIDGNGINVATDISKISTQIENNKFSIKDNSGRDLTFIGYDENEQISKAEMDNLTVDKYFITGNHRFEKYKGNRTGIFYIGG